MTSVAGAERIEFNEAALTLLKVDHGRGTFASFVTRSST